MFFRDSKKTLLSKLRLYRLGARRNQDLEPIHFSALLDVNAPLTIIEVGAGDGSNTNLFLKVFPLASIFSFEPEPRCIELYKKNINSKRAELVPIALAAKNNRTTFYRSGGPHSTNPMYADWPFSGSIRRPNTHTEFYPRVTFTDTITVSTRPLDEWVKKRKLNKVDLIWADVQGAESDLIQGAKQTLANTSFFYTEYDNRELYKGQANLAHLRNMMTNFEMIGRFKQNVLFQNQSLRPTKKVINDIK
jgi:2-O-methyltransferase